MGVHLFGSGGCGQQQGAAGLKLREQAHKIHSFKRRLLCFSFGSAEAAAAMALRGWRGSRNMTEAEAAFRTFAKAV